MLYVSKTILSYLMILQLELAKSSGWSLAKSEDPLVFVESKPISQGKLCVRFSDFSRRTTYN
jgi:hypothetical protein